MTNETEKKISYFKSMERIFLDRAQSEPDRKFEHLRSAEGWRRLAQFRQFLTDNMRWKKKSASENKESRLPPVDLNS